LIASLRSLRARARWLLVLRRLALLAADVLLVALVAGLLDMWLRFPGGLRTIAWLVALAGVVVLLVRWVGPALTFKPTLTDVALRVERTRPELAGRLASAVDFSRTGDATASRTNTSGADRMAEAMAARVVRETVGSFSLRDAMAIVRPAPAAQGSILAVLALVLVAVPLVQSPRLWSIGASRVLLPWSDATWPKRTGVGDATVATVHPLGEALPLRAMLTKWRTEPAQTDVAVRYRVANEDGVEGPTRRELLTFQGGEAADGGTVGTYVFERLIEPLGTAIVYRFETEDDATPWRRVTLVPPPEVKSARVEITPPAYARESLASAGPDDELALEADLGPGLDERALAPAALEGSRLELTITLNKPALLPGGVEPSASTFAPLLEGGARVESFEAEGGVWRASLIAREPFRLALELEDQYAIPSVEEAVYRFAVLPDEPPTATVTNPPSDETVLPTAVIGVSAEARDDVSLERVALTRQRWVPAGSEAGSPSGPGGALEAAGEPGVTQASDVSPGTTAALVEYELDLGALQLDAGDEVHLVGLAYDIFEDASGVARRPSASLPRILRIIDEERFIEEVRSRLADVRQQAIRLAEGQRELRERTTERGVDPSTARTQSQIGQRIERQLDALDDLAQRVERNRLDDAALDDLLGESRDAAVEAGERAAQAAQRASEAQAAAERDPENRPTPEERQAIEDEQRATEDELQRLVSLLDRGEDTWVVRSTIENLLEQQQELAQQTERVGQETTGLRPEELTEAQREALEQIAREQDELAQRTERLTQELRERARAMRESDPAAAAGLEQAAQRAEQERTAEQMQQASQNAQQNQTQQAQRAQQQAAESLEEMLRDLDESERNRQEVLQRQLLSLIESIEAIIKRQQEELDRLTNRTPDAHPSAFDQPLITLANNTLAVAGEARAGGPEFAAIAGLIERAADAQGRGVAGLRQDAPDWEEAERQEMRALDLLVRAKEQAEQMQEQLEQEENERKKRELKRAYRAALEMQIDLRDRTQPFAELDELSRRDRVRLRQLDPPQQEIRTTLADLRAQTTEFDDARVYDYAHERLDRMANLASDAITGAEPALAVRRQDAVVQTLIALLDSLEDPEPDEEQFEEGSGGQQGGGGSGGQQQQEGLVSELGELRLLRSMQMAIAEETRDYHEGLLGDDPGVLDTLSDQQEGLADAAVNLIERLSQTQVPLDYFPDGPQGPSGGTDSPLDDAPTPEEAPEEEGPMNNPSPADDNSEESPANAEQGGDA